MCFGIQYTDNSLTLSSIINPQLDSSLFPMLLFLPHYNRNKSGFTTLLLQLLYRNCVSVFVIWTIRVPFFSNFFVDCDTSRLRSICHFILPLLWPILSLQERVGCKFKEIVNISQTSLWSFSLLGSILNLEASLLLNQWGLQINMKRPGLLSSQPHCELNDNYSVSIERWGNLIRLKAICSNLFKVVCWMSNPMLDICAWVSELCSDSAERTFFPVFSTYFRKRSHIFYQGSNICLHDHYPMPWIEENPCEPKALFYGNKWFAAIGLSEKLQFKGAISSPLSSSCLVHWVPSRVPSVTCECSPKVAQCH